MGRRHFFSEADDELIETLHEHLATVLNEFHQNQAIVMPELPPRYLAHSLKVEPEEVCLGLPSYFCPDNHRDYGLSKLAQQVACLQEAQINSTMTNLNRTCNSLLMQRDRNMDMEKL
ncbi:hypothetical protein GYMLUDRAFT_251731 [Collybiopsis luxurians FD-317 M1]|uniref:Uncharacterized protein n=1 Tax=Collybiopsis luxurians FD-317 M1 TaxID=944289 RepID=A0A0D0CAD1_9AGAR|nr:hypothetical protein GYMLUDRAFT_251731 [Collybiopsis luxurians FD-317 M1]